MLMKKPSNCSFVNFSTCIQSSAHLKHLKSIHLNCRRCSRLISGGLDSKWVKKSVDDTLSIVATWTTMH